MILGSSLWPFSILAALNAWFVAGELDFVIRDSDPSVLVLDSERFTRLQSAGTLDAIIRDLPGLKKIVLIRTPKGVGKKYGPLVEHWEDIMARMKDRTMPHVNLQPDDPCTIYFSSGTTGRRVS